MKKSLLKVTEKYLIKKLESNTATAQEIAIIPQILEAKKRRPYYWPPKHY